MKLDALVVIGGDGTLQIAHQFYLRGIPIVGVPKTIDNDIWGTTSCFGFDTAVSFAADAIDRLHTTAEAHRRIMVVEVMGRYAGLRYMPESPAEQMSFSSPRSPTTWTRSSPACASAKASGEIQHRRRGRRGEATGGALTLLEEAHSGHVERLGGVGAIVASALQERPARKHVPSSSGTSNAVERRRPSIECSQRDLAARPSSCSSGACSVAWWPTTCPTSSRFRWRMLSGRRRPCRLITICSRPRGQSVWRLGIDTHHVGGCQREGLSGGATGGFQTWWSGRIPKYQRTTRVERRPSHRARSFGCSPIVESLPAPHHLGRGTPPWLPIATMSRIMSASDTASAHRRCHVSPEESGNSIARGTRSPSATVDASSQGTVSAPCSIARTIGAQPSAWTETMRGRPANPADRLQLVERFPHPDKSGASAGWIDDPIGERPIGIARRAQPMVFALDAIRLFRVTRRTTRAACLVPRPSDLHRL